MINHEFMDMFIVFIFVNEKTNQNEFKFRYITKKSLEDIASSYSDRS